jgi:hypothetical protein
VEDVGVRPRIRERRCSWLASRSWVRVLTGWLEKRERSSEQAVEAEVGEWEWEGLEVVMRRRGMGGISRSTQGSDGLKWRMMEMISPIRWMLKGLTWSTGMADDVIWTSRKILSVQLQ